MTLSKREKKVIVIGAVLCSMVLLIKLMILPTMERGEILTEAIAAKQGLLVKYQETVMNGPQLETRIETLKESIAKREERLILGESPTLASAELQSILEKIAKQTNTTLKSIKTLDAVDLGDYSTVSVEMTFSSNIRSLLNFLYEVENNEKALSILEMDVHLRERRPERRLRTVLQVRAGMKNKGGPGQGEQASVKRHGKGI